MADAAIKPLALTAFYCRAHAPKDAASARPVCGDNLAAKFIDERNARASCNPALAFRGPCRQQRRAPSHHRRHRRAALAKNPIAE